ncbi:MAG: DNA primase, partial [Kineosporiaceae bacterium]
VRRLVESRQPLFEFAIKSTLARLDLDTAEGRVQALRAAAPVVARIKDPALRPEYARRLAGWLGMDVEPVARAVAQAGRSAASGDGRAADRAGSPRTGRHAQAGPANGGGPRDHRRPGEGAPPDAGAAAPPPGLGPAPDPRDPVARVEREALECLLQVPALVPMDEAEGLDDEAFEVPAYRAVHQAIRAAGGIARARTLSGTAWAEAVHEEAPMAVAALVTQLAVTPLPADSDDAVARYAASVVLRLAEVEVTRKIGMIRSRVQRLDPDDPAAGPAFADLLAAEARRRSFRERITGG